jgi:hypothetical protein
MRSLRPLCAIRTALAAFDRVPFVYPPAAPRTPSESPHPDGRHAGVWGAVHSCRTRTHKRRHASQRWCASGGSPTMERPSLRVRELPHVGQRRGLSDARWRVMGMRVSSSIGRKRRFVISNDPCAWSHGAEADACPTANTRTTKSSLSPSIGPLATARDARALTRRRQRRGPVSWCGVHGKPRGR